MDEALPANARKVLARCNGRMGELIVESGQQWDVIAGQVAVVGCHSLELLQDDPPFQTLLKDVAKKGLRYPEEVLEMVGYLRVFVDRLKTIRAEQASQYQISPRLLDEMISIADRSYRQLAEMRSYPVRLTNPISPDLTFGRLKEDICYLSGLFGQRPLPPEEDKSKTVASKITTAATVLGLFFAAISAGGAVISGASDFPDMVGGSEDPLTTVCASYLVEEAADEVSREAEAFRVEQKPEVEEPYDEPSVERGDITQADRDRAFREWLRQTLSGEQDREGE